MPKPERVIKLKMSKLEKVIKGLEKLIDNAGCVAIYDADCKSCPYISVNGCIDQIYKDALELLKTQEKPTVKECKDLQVLRDIKSGKVLKSGCKEYVIYNGDWYRKNRWDWPEKAQEPVKPEFVKHIEPDFSYWACGACGAFIWGNAMGSDVIKVIYRPNYCQHCGREVKWDG